jgi:hypothetical protein
MTLSAEMVLLCLFLVLRFPHTISVGSKKLAIDSAQPLEDVMNIQCKHTPATSDS